eukprot:PLAT10491.2.p2 GENE.PLAT10491.2~~PLAT10491.2.p2  ORF type:complete len:207 (-),score=64.26 PLAT10491.2:50-670(-)
MHRLRPLHLPVRPAVGRLPRSAVSQCMPHTTTVLARVSSTEGEEYELRLGEGGESRQLLALFASPSGGGSAADGGDADVLEMGKPFARQLELRLACRRRKEPESSSVAVARAAAAAAKAAAAGAAPPIPPTRTAAAEAAEAEGGDDTVLALAQPPIGSSLASSGGSVGDEGSGRGKAGGRASKRGASQLGGAAGPSKRRRMEMVAV